MTANQGMKKWNDFLRSIGKGISDVNLNVIMIWERKTKKEESK